MSSEVNTKQQPTEEQIVEARFEAVKVVTAVAERVLLNAYERQIVIQACALSLQGLQAEYARITAPGESESDLEEADTDDVIDRHIEEEDESSESEDTE